MGSLVVWTATGAFWYTRFHSEEIQAMNEENDLDELFAETGALGPPGSEQDQVTNVTAIGLLPSGPGRASISVATIGGPAALAALGALVLGARNGRSGPGRAGRASANAESPPESTQSMGKEHP